MAKLTIRDFDPAGKRVLVRVDFNVPIEDGKVKDDSRIRAALPTLAHLLANNAAVILMSHLGRPKGKVVESARLRPVAARLSALIGRPVPVTGDALGVGTRDAVARLKPGQVLMLENLRFHSEEEANDREFARTIAGYGDIYVNDAFGTAHRAHASTVGMVEFLPAYAGLLMEREIAALSSLLESKDRPFAAVIGGAKVSGKLAVLDNLMKRVDAFLIGGGMANTFLVAEGHTVGKSLLERELVEDARRILDNAARKGVQFHLPTDVVVAKEVTRGAEHKIVPVNKIPNSWSVVDIGPDTRDTFRQALDPARTVFWNGPLGVFEVPTFGDGTRAIARYLASRAEAGAMVVVGGGDSVAAIEELGLSSKMSHISTGGGASLEFLEGRELPGVAVIRDRPVEKAPPKATVRKPAPAKVGAKAPAKSTVKTSAKSAPKASAKAASKAPTKAATKAPTRAARKTPTKAASKAPTRAATKRPTKPATTKPAPKPPTRAATKRPTKPATTKPAPKPPTKLPTKPPAKARPGAAGRNSGRSPGRRAAS